MMGYGGFGPGFGAMAGLGGFGMLLGLLFWAGVIALTIWGVGLLFPQRPGAGHPDALELLRRRFARGEISQAEFEETKRALG